MYDARSEECLVGHLGDDVGTVLAKDYHVVQVGAVTHIFVLLHGVAIAEESALPIDIEFGVGHGHFGLCDGVELPDFGLALASHSPEHCENADFVSDAGNCALRFRRVLRLIRSCR